MLLEDSISSPANNRASGSSARTDLDVGVIDPLTDSRWDLWVQAHPDFSFFHTAAWAKVLVKTYGHKPIYLRFSRHGQTTALIPLMEVRSFVTGCRAVCVPFSDSCAPLIFNTDSAHAILDFVKGLALQNRWRHFEIRGPLGLSNVEGPTTNSNEYLGHILAIDDNLERLFSGFSSGTRGAIRKAQKSNLTSQISTSQQAVLEFYRLHQQTRRRHGVPPQPLSFFVNIYEEVIKRGMGFVVQATLGARPVASAVYFRYGRKAIYKYGASDESVGPLRANNLVKWEAIQFLARSGVHELNFGRTSLGNNGLRRFKRSWGAAESTLAYHQFDIATDRWVRSADRASGAHTQIFSRLPAALNRLAGALIYPHLD
jgi:hypothetical protein